MIGMEIFYFVGFLIVGGLIVFNFIYLLECVDGNATYEEVFNPIYIYNHISVNMFGAIFLCILGHIACLPAAPFFWLYKLCTVGRRQDNGTR